MNPLVEKMLGATISNDTETRLLEDLFEHEAKCQSRYHETPCSDTAVAIFSYACEPIRTPLVCNSVLQDTLEAIEDEGCCFDCGELLENCWTIRPI